MAKKEKQRQIDKLTPRQRLLFISRTLDRAKGNEMLGMMAVASLVGIGITKEEMIAVVDEHIVLDDWLEEGCKLGIIEMEKRQEETKQSVINN